MSELERFRAIVREEAEKIEVGHLAQERVGPTRLNMLMGNTNLARPNSLSGRLAHAREEVLEELGFERLPAGFVNRWVRIRRP